MRGLTRPFCRQRLGLGEYIEDTGRERARGRVVRRHDNQRQYPSGERAGDGPERVSSGLVGDERGVDHDDPWPPPSRAGRGADPHVEVERFDEPPGLLGQWDLLHGEGPPLIGVAP